MGVTVVTARDFDLEVEIDWETRDVMSKMAKWARDKKNPNTASMMVEVPICPICGEGFICIEAEWQAFAALTEHLGREHGIYPD